MSINKDLITELKKDTILNLNDTNFKLEDYGKAVSLGYKNNSTGYIEFPLKDYRYLCIIAGYGGYYYCTCMPTSVIVVTQKKLVFTARNYNQEFTNGWIQYSNPNAIYVSCNYGTDTETWFYGIK